MGTAAKKLGATIRMFREVQKMSREGLAERAGLHPNYLGSVERGETNAGIENIAKVAKALKVPVHRLFIPKGGADSLDELWVLLATADDKTAELMVKLLRVVKDSQKA